MGKKGRNIWDIFAWVVLSLIALWLILKALGFINTPTWVQYSPFFGVIYLAGWAMHKLDRATDDIKDIKGEVKFVKENLRGIELDMNVIRKKCPELKNGN